MSTVELTELQRQITTVLVNKYRQSGEPVGSQTLADALDRTPGTVRNNMQHLKHLGIAGSIPGPGGGYRPTQTAFEKLGRDPHVESEAVTLATGFTRIPATVDNITFPNVLHPDTCRARVSLQQSVDDIESGDPIIIGPTPQSALVVAGEVLSITDTRDSILLDVAKIKAPLED